MSVNVLERPVSPAEVNSTYKVTVDEYRSFQKNGYLVVRGLVSAEDIAELRAHTEDLMEGRLPEQNLPAAVAPLPTPPAGLSQMEKAQFFLRIHMLHRKLELHERYLLHPRVLDVLESIVAPDILALQTMLFIKGPGQPGQGWHQDRIYIPTHPDSLCGAWIAIDDVDEFNGAMWMAQGSNVEPVYPPKNGYGYGTRKLSDIPDLDGFSNIDDDANELSPIADKYPQVLIAAKAGDVVFFGGHILHRSKQNVTTDRFRRAFVSHYCSARAFTVWGADSAPDDPHEADKVDPITHMTNGSHILARGDTHLPFAQPLFGTKCAATKPATERSAGYAYGAATVMASADGSMEPVADDPARRDED